MFILVCCIVTLCWCEYRLDSLSHSAGDMYGNTYSIN